MKRKYLLTTTLALLLAACGRAVPPPSAAAPTSLIVFAAASLTQSLGEIGDSFEAAHPGMAITFNFAGSQALRTQVEQGAPADIFASASPADMDALAAGGYVHRPDVQELVTNRLVLILPANNPAGITELPDIARPGVKLVVAAEDVPVGEYARQALDNMNGSYGEDFKTRVLANVVSNEDNVKQVVAKIQLGEADAGIVYVSDAVASPGLKTIDIPPALNVLAHYFVAPLARSRDRLIAGQFVDYLLSPSAAAVFAKWGFGPRP